MQEGIPCHSQIKYRIPSNKQPETGRVHQSLSHIIAVINKYNLGDSVNGDNLKTNADVLLNIIM